MNVYSISQCDENEINRILDMGIQQLKNLHCPENNYQNKFNSQYQNNISTITTNFKSPKKQTNTYTIKKSGESLEKIKNGLKQVGDSINKIEKKLFNGQKTPSKNAKKKVKKTFKNENLNNQNKNNINNKINDNSINKDPCQDCSFNDEECNERIKITQRQNLLNKLEDRERELNNLKLQKDNTEKEKFTLKNQLENLRKELSEIKYEKEKNDKEIETLNVYKVDLNQITNEFNQLQNQLKLSEEIREQQKELIEKLEQNIDDLRNGTEGNIIDFENIHNRNKEDDLEKKKIKEGKKIAKKINQKIQKNRSNSKKKISYIKKK
jgi:chromosome segregation ATPase